MTSEERTDLYRIFSLIDLTSLESTDTVCSIEALCRKAIGFGQKGLPLPAAVCVFPVFVSTARKLLDNSGIAVAAVACGFPHGQVPMAARIAETLFALDQGADEIDMVFPRGLILSGEYNQLMDDICTIRDICKGAKLKVILETGELRLPEHITRASMIAMEAGADFIKTSTGRMAVGATPENVSLMAEAIAGYLKKTGKRTGIKPAGGISHPADAIRYMTIIKARLGEGWIHPSLFRIGASRLADELAEMGPPD